MRLGRTLGARDGALSPFFQQPEETTTESRERKARSFGRYWDLIS
jgi:hypothetical protein